MSTDTSASSTPTPGAKEDPKHTYYLPSSDCDGNHTWVAGDQCDFRPVTCTSLDDADLELDNWDRTHPVCFVVSNHKGKPFIAQQKGVAPPVDWTFTPVKIFNRKKNNNNAVCKSDDSVHDMSAAGVEDEKKSEEDEKKSEEDEKKEDKNEADESEDESGEEDDDDAVCAPPFTSIVWTSEDEPTVRSRGTTTTSTVVKSVEEMYNKEIMEENDVHFHVIMNADGVRLFYNDPRPHTRVPTGHTHEVVASDSPSELLEELNFTEYQVDEDMASTTVACIPSHELSLIDMVMGAEDTLSASSECSMLDIGMKTAVLGKRCMDWDGDDVAWTRVIPFHALDANLTLTYSPRPRAPKKGKHSEEETIVQ